MIAGIILGFLACVVLLLASAGSSFMTPDEAEAWTLETERSNRNEP